LSAVGSSQIRIKEESMNTEGDVSLFNQIGKKRIGLLILSGTMRGIYGGAQVSVLERYGLTYAFEVIVGVSTGTPTALYFAGGQAVLGTTIYLEECTTREFLSLTPSRIIQGTVADVGYLEKIFAGLVGNKKMSTQWIQANSTDVYVGVTEYETGRGVLINAKEVKEGPSRAALASIAIPGLYRPPVFVDGIRYGDGGVGIPFPSREIIEKWELDGLIVLANRHSSYSKSVTKQVISKLVGLSVPINLRTAMQLSDYRYKKGLSFLRTRQIPYCIVWSNKLVGSYTTNSIVLREAHRLATEHLEGILSS
jgi:predicted patatin/cPLA2 family phospholipase